MTRLLPRSLPGWILLIVVLALALAQGATLVVVTREIAAVNRTEDLFRLGERTLALARELQGTQPAQRKIFLQNINGLTISAEFDGSPAVTSIIAKDDELAEMDDLLMAKLSNEGVLDLRIDQRKPGSQDPLNRAEPAAGGDSGDVAERLSELSSGFAASGRHIVSMQLADGAWLNFTVPMTPTPSLLGRQGLPIFLAVSAVIVALCLWAVIQLTAPYRRLERAATKISGDLNTPPLRESGSREARAAIRSVNVMQTKLKEYVADREHLAAALAHDLRTPLTRMKLRCELMRTSKDKQQLQSDIEELQAIVASVIDFASMTSSGEPRSKTDVVSLLQTVCDGFGKASVAAETAALQRLVITAQPIALGRCLRNLVENAVRYGGCATASVQATDGHIEIRIEDSGPGIPPDELHNVLKPFYRLESSRNQASGGTGLGLAIAETIARAQDGTLTLHNRETGGIRAILTLPRG